MFYFGRQSQGAQAPVYPYPMFDVLTGNKVDRTYKIVYLENEYLRIGILPEIGGRIFEGLDKTNNYNFIYRQHVIKPALIGIIGAWISGGVEWNIPHHHRASTFMPVQYKVEENADGSKTVWVGELEIRHRMRWAVGYTVRPGKSYLEASLRILNRTPEVNTMLCFANLAVHVNDDYQVIFPPSTQYGTGHSKRAFQKWPVSSLRGADGAEKTVDVSWLKNHIDSTSIFAWNYEDDFFAGYDHGRQAGTMSVADHNIVPGKKFFTWGKGPGRVWDNTLTDTDGPYIELMVGAYSDNQPDYSWLEPYEGRSFSMNWYPFRGIGGVKKANLEAAVNLDVAQGVAKVGFYTTSAHRAARVSLSAGSRKLLDEEVPIDPAKPYRKEVALPAGIDGHDLVASISDGGRELVSYSPVRLAPEPAPKPVVSPQPPAQVKSNEELYLIGLRATQFHDPNVDPEPYFEEALRRDPGDSRVNTALGIARFRTARYEEAEKLFRTAIERVTANYTSPKDGEALYYLGATLKAQGRLDEAYKYLYKATWNQGWKAAGYYGLAEIAASRGQMGAALEFADRSIDSNALNIRALNLKAALLRHAGRSKDALQLLETAAHRVDPLDVRSMAERWLASSEAGAGKRFASTMYEHPATAQETAAEYLNAGLWQDGTAVLLQMTENAPDAAKVHPMAYYYLAYFADRMGQPGKAAAFRKQAMSLAPDYVFPFQREAIEVLSQAARADARDARARYYLGNLLYDWQPEAAARLWKESAAIDPSFAMVHRNLATALAPRKPEPDLKAAIGQLEKAVACERKYALHFAELDELYEQAAVPVEKRLPLFDNNRAIVATRDDAQNRALALMLLAGKYDDAIQVMSNRKFALAEGANLNVSEQWTSAHMLRGRTRLAAKQYREALADFETALNIPSNLPVPYEGGSRVNAEAAYWTGVAYEGLGDREKAAASWNRGAAQPAAGGRRRGGPVSFGQTYYQARCLARIGRAAQARTIFEQLVSAGQRPGEPPAAGPAGRGRTQSPRVRSAVAHYTAGLGYLGLGDAARARAEFQQSVELSPDLLGARTAMAEAQ
jgi:tetratricopeptide (TPR) repeat protein